MMNGGFPLHIYTHKRFTFLLIAEFVVVVEIQLQIMYFSEDRRQCTRTIPPHTRHQLTAG